MRRRRGGVRTPRQAVPAPATRKRMLLERDAELSAARAVLNEAHERRGGALALTGGWGMGRTELLAAIADTADGGGARILSARCGRDGCDLPHGVALQLLEALRPVPGARRSGSCFAGAALAARFLEAPERTPAYARDEALLIHSLIRVFANLAAELPLALVVDDVQWADERSLHLLAALAHRLPGLPVALFVAAREPDPRADAAAHRELLAQASRADLAPLGSESVRMIVERVAGACQPELAAACHRETGGVPALVMEAAHALRERSECGERMAGDDKGLSTALVTPGLCDRLGAELGRLPQSARAVAGVAAVLGDAARGHRIAKLCGLGQEDVAGAETALEHAGVFDPARPFRFAQPLLGTAVRLQIPPAEAARLHAEAARVLRDEHEPDECVGAHLLRAAPAARDWVAANLRVAARDALARGDAQLAVALLERALAEPPPPAERPELIVELGRAQGAAGWVTAAKATLAPAARRAGRPDGSAGAALELAWLLAARGEVEEAAALLEEAIEATPAHASESVELEGAWLDTARGSVELRPAAAGRAGQVPAGPRGESATWLANAACHLALSGASPQRVKSLARQALQRRAAPAARAGALQALLWSGETEEVRHALAERADPDARHAEGYTETLLAAQCAHHGGLLAEAEERARRAAAADPGDARAYTETGARRLVLVLTDRGDPQAGERVASEALARVEGSLARAGLLLARAGARNATGDYRAALADATTAGRVFGSAAVLNPSVAPWRSTAGVAAAGLGDAGRARELIDEELVLARAHGSPQALAAALRVAASIASGREAIALLSEAEAALRGTQARCERAAVLTELGAAYRKHGSQSRARTVLREALASVDRIGAAALERRARAELELASARTRGRGGSGPGALTAAERRVVDLAVEGLTNREIAGRLFVTRKTVEWHLRNCFRKLDVRSRGELAGALEAADRR